MRYDLSERIVVAARVVPELELVDVQRQVHLADLDAAAIRETAETEDLRRPYDSQGAWDLDGRPAEQRHGGELRKTPSGWDTGPGDHRALVGRYRQPNNPGAIKSPYGQGFSRKKRSVWTIATAPFPGPHFATFPPALVEPCILAGCPPGGSVLDPFLGSGTTGLVADRLGRDCIGIELNPADAAMAQRRIEGDASLFAEVAQVDNESAASIAKNSGAAA